MRPVPALAHGCRCQTLTKVSLGPWWVSIPSDPLLQWMGLSITWTENVTECCGGLEQPWWLWPVPLGTSSACCSTGERWWEERAAQATAQWSLGALG